MSETKVARLKREREEQVVEFIKQGMTAREIGERVGWQTDNAGNNRKDIANKYGLKVPENKAKKVVPYGLTDESRKFRNALGDRLYRLRQVNKLHHLEIARDVGVPMKHQTEAMNGKPPTHNWNLAQLERLARALKINFTKLMVLSLKRDLEEQAGSKKTAGQLVDEWLTGN